MIEEQWRGNRVLKYEISLLIKYPHILLLAEEMKEHKPCLLCFLDDRYNFARAIVLFIDDDVSFELSEVLTKQ